MSDVETFKARYVAACHAVQSGVAMEIQRKDQVKTLDNRFKDVRTGLNVAMADAGAIATLLISKGVFTEEEMWAALANGAEREKARLEDELTKDFGGNTKITLA